MSATYFGKEEDFQFFMALNLRRGQHWLQLTSLVKLLTLRQFAKKLR
jgi:hypothetical protein